MLSVRTGGGKWGRDHQACRSPTSTLSSPPPNEILTRRGGRCSLACSGFEPRQKNSGDSRTPSGSRTQQGLLENRALTVTNTRCPRKPHLPPTGLPGRHRAARRDERPRVHPLRGFRPTRYSVHVNGPWCITFEFEEATSVASTSNEIAEESAVLTEGLLFKARYSVSRHAGLFGSRPPTCRRPDHLSDNLVVELGLATEELNRRWYESNTCAGAYGCAVTNPASGAALDGRDARRSGRGAKKRQEYWVRFA